MRDKIDPDPFSIVVGVSGIIGGLASAVSLYSQFAKQPLGKALSQIKQLLRESKDLVRYIELDVEILREIISEAEVPGDRRFRPGRRAFLTTKQFQRYEKAADELMNRLRRVLRVAHRLDRLVPASTALNLPDASLHIESAQGRLERILRDRDITIDKAIQDLLAGIGELKAMIGEVLASLDHD